MRVSHAAPDGFSRLTVSSSSFAATVAPSLRIVPATALARARVWDVRAVVSTADRESTVGVGVPCRPRSWCDQPVTGARVVVGTGGGASVVLVGCVGTTRPEM